MGKFSPILLLLLLLPLLAVPAWADEAESAYQGAKEAQRRLFASSKQQLYRDNWLRVLERFRAVQATYPQSPRAPAALYQAGKTCSGLYQISRATKDAREALSCYDELVRLYPQDRLADDALLLGAEILDQILQDPGQAYLRYRRLVEDYPRGDMAPAARQGAARLVVHAPKPVAEKRIAPRPPLPVETPATLTTVKTGSNPGVTRVVFELSAPVSYTQGALSGDAGAGLASRLFIDLKGARLAAEVTPAVAVEDGRVQRVRLAQYDPQTVRVVLDLASRGENRIFTLSDPFRLVVDVLGTASSAGSDPTPQWRAAPGSATDAIGRLLGNAPAEPQLQLKLPDAKTDHRLRRIVVDAGHGGKDPGAIGPGGTMEKDVALAMAREVAKHLEADLGCEVILTRDRDVYLTLQERTAIANRVNADLFISIHANASTNQKAYGVETYYLNFSKNDQAMAVAARENGTSLKQVGDLELILLDLLANSKINESSRLAAEIQKSLVDGLGDHYGDIKDLGVRQGPFHVLLGATMPSVLVETAFISNRSEERRLKDKKFHKRTAAAIAKAVGNYATALKMVASK